MRSGKCMLAIALLGLADAGHARYFKDNDRAPLNPVYVDECGSCHLAYPAEFLNEASWKTLLDGLGEHFKSDASLDEAEMKIVRKYLLGHARSKGMGGESPVPVKVSTSRWFTARHGDTDSAGYPKATVKTMGNCEVCHPKAQTNLYHPLAQPAQ